MKRICVLGNAGSGKSTLARALSQRLGLPVYHLDAIFWRPGWLESDRPEFNYRAAQLALEDAWVIDGNYSNTFPVRLERADTAVLLDLPVWVSLGSVLRRWWIHRGRTRPDMAPGCPEKVDLEFVRWVLGGQARTRRTLEQLQSSPALEVHVFRSRRAAWAWLESLEGSGPPGPA